MGAGGGGSISAVNLDNANSGVFEVEGTDAEVVFAWQVFAGLKYHLGERLDLGVMYKYFATDDGAQSHSISAMVSFGF